MTSIPNSEVFFFISSIGFIILGLLVAILIVMTMRAIASISRILDKVESSMDTIGDATIDLIEEVREHAFFRMIFGGKKKRRSKQPRD